MAYTEINNVENKLLFYWREGLRDLEGYAISPSITLNVDSRSTITLTVEIRTIDALKFEDDTFEQRVVLEPFKGEKKFDFEWKVKFLANSIIKKPPELKQVPIPIIGQALPPQIYRVKENRLLPRPYIKIKVIDTGGQTNSKGFFLKSKREVINEVTS